MKKYIPKILACIFLLIALPFVVPVFHPGSDINSIQQEINIHNGKARFSRKIWYVPYGERIEETALSTALEGESFIFKDIKPWHRVNTFSPGLGHSPHHRFHGALNQASLFGMLKNLLTDVQKKEIAQEILRLWQIEGDYHRASEYIESKLSLFLDSR